MDDSHLNDSPLKITSKALVRIIRAKDRKAAAPSPQREPQLPVPPPISLSKKSPKIPVEELAGRVKKTPKGRFVTSGKLDDVANLERVGVATKGKGRVEHRALYKSGRLTSLEPMRSFKSVSGESGLGKTSEGRRTTFGRAKPEFSKSAASKSFDNRPSKFGDSREHRFGGASSSPRSDSFQRGSAPSRDRRFSAGPSGHCGKVGDGDFASSRQPRSASFTRENRPFGGSTGGSADRRFSGGFGLGKSKGNFGNKPSNKSNPSGRSFGKKAGFTPRHPKFGGSGRGSMKP